MNWSLIIIALLTASVAGGGYLLKQSYKDNGRQSALTKQWQTANNLSIKTLMAERKQFSQLQHQMLARENEYALVQSKLSTERKRLNEIPDESNCLDVDLGRAFWMSIESGDPASDAMRTD